MEFLEYALKGEKGLEVTVLNYGAIIRRILVPDGSGELVDVVLGFERPQDYLQEHPYFGAIVGRFANRIAHGRFSLKGKDYQLSRNHGPHHLHGGFRGIDKLFWETISHGKSFLELQCSLKDWEEGYPGNVTIKARYEVSALKLKLTLSAHTDASTIINLAQHSYFNLQGASMGTIEEHYLTIWSDGFTEVDSELIPTGKIKTVEGAMDFRREKKIGEGLKAGAGFDHNYVLSAKEGPLKKAALLVSPDRKRRLLISTTQPGVQFYSGNFLDGHLRGKYGVFYRKHHGLCLETQHFPDAPNHPHFPSTVLNPGERYEQITEYDFSV